MGSRTERRFAKGSLWLALGTAAGLPFLTCCKKAAENPIPAIATRPASPVYENRQYGFRFVLPEDWKGYQVLEQTWQGTTQQEPQRTEEGPKIILRDPRWTQNKPRQDIPIMVFTLAQWSEDLIVSAAPIGPSELARNAHYVFALPPRYNFAFPDGYQEVEAILQAKPLHAF